MSDFGATTWTPDAFRPFEEIRAEEALLQRLEARRLNVEHPPPTPDPRYFIGNNGICTPGNLTALAAAVKSGKSSYVGAMIAAVITQDPTKADCLGLRSSNPLGYGLLHFDTEQSPYDHFDLMKRALARAGIDAPPPWFLSYCLTGFPLLELRLAVKLAMAKAATRFKGIHSVIIDGVADLAADVNNPEESNGLVTDLHGQAIEHHCPIIGVIHLNPGAQDKTRGHLGSQLERKAETNLRLEKSDEITVVWSDKNRRAPILKDRGPCFQWSDEKGMHISVPNISQTREAERIRKLRDCAEAVFLSAQKNYLSWSELVGGIEQIEKLSDGGARKRLDAMRKMGVIRKASYGTYEIG